METQTAVRLRWCVRVIAVLGAAVAGGLLMREVSGHLPENPMVFQESSGSSVTLLELGPERDLGDEYKCHAVRKSSARGIEYLFRIERGTDMVDIPIKDIQRLITLSTTLGVQQPPVAEGLFDAVVSWGWNDLWIAYRFGSKQWITNMRIESFEEEAQYKMWPKFFQSLTEAMLDIDRMKKIPVSMKI